MDDIIDLEVEKIDKILDKIAQDPEAEEVKLVERRLWEKIKEKTLQGRRTGVGITAEGDMLAALGLRYGTKEATNFAESVHKELALSVYRSSVVLAKERGAFPIYDNNLEKNNPFLNRLFDQDPTLKEDMLKYGRRNIACLTIAPTGSTSMLSQTSSGIEPVFLSVYKRRRRITSDDPNIKADFIDEVGDRYEETTVFHDKFKVWMQIAGYDTSKKYTESELNDLIAKSPYYKAMANDVDWVEKVRMQGVIQKWVDHSISVTVNLPNDVSVELVDKIYKTAWENGCKGCTIYRDGSRSGVLVSAKEEKKVEKKDDNTLPKKRPKVLNATITHFRNNKESWVAIIGTKEDGTPYEIFTGKADGEDGLVIPKSILQGKVIKSKVNGVNTYTLEYYNSKGMKTTVEGLEQKFNPEYWNYARLVSGMLRYEVPLDGIVRVWSHLDLDDAVINTYKNGVERALKKFMNEDHVKDQECPNCKEHSIKMVEGCLKCISCGYSKCG